jgi:hypothetical protein
MSIVLDECTPYVVAAPWNRPFFDMKPFGLPIPEANVINPLRLDSEPFLVLLETMDGLTFGPEGMPMPRWVFYNCSELPGGVMGFAKPAHALSERQRRIMNVREGYSGLVPLSMYIAIPMQAENDWFGHNLASMNGVFPEAGLKGLGSMTKAYGLAVYRTARQWGATQWNSRALNIHTKFGPLDLITAYTPAHSEPMTLTYRIDITETGLRYACGDRGAEVVRPAPSLWLDADDVDGACALQDEIEAGTRFQIVDRPKTDGDRILHPIVRLG